MFDNVFKSVSMFNFTEKVKEKILNKIYIEDTFMQVKHNSYQLNNTFFWAREYTVLDIVHME